MKMKMMKKIKTIIYPIEGYLDYWISREGIVWSYKINKFKKLKSYFGHGYPRVRLQLNKKAYDKTIHRLIAETFIPNPENKPCVNHKNGIKSDNRVENLEWVTYSENSLHSHKIGLSKKSPLSGCQSIPIRQYDLEGNFIAEFESQCEAARQTKIHLSNISSCRRGKLKTAGGYIWRYIT